MTSPVERFDVVVLGAGPAGAAITHSVMRRGLSVALVDPALDRHWTHTLGSWVDDLDPCDDSIVVKGLARRTWPNVRVVGEREHVLARPYLVFDNAKFRGHLIGIGYRPFHCKATSVVSRVDADGFQREVGLSTGETIAARVVVDAGGSSSGFLERQRHHATGVQSAYGVLTRRGGIVPTDSFTLMDWRPATDRMERPTFLYAMDFGDGTSMVEETSLVEPTARSATDLRELLHRRIGSDVTVDAIDIEDVHIAMGGAPPEPSTRVVGFGAAGGFIHPVTGYSVAASLRAAPRLADALCDIVNRGASSDEITRRSWDVLWPAGSRRTRALHDYGLAALNRLRTRDIQQFFDGFFDLPEDAWSGYLRIDTAPGDIARTMTMLFSRLPRSLKMRIATSSPRALSRLVAG